MTLGRSYVQSGILFVKAESIDERGSVDHERCAHIDLATDALLARSRLQTGDLLFSIAGVIGRVGQVSEADVPANTNQALAIVRLKISERPRQGYWFYALQSPVVRAQVEGFSVQAAQANVSLGDLRALKVPHALPAEQSAIATALGDVDALLAAQDALIAKKRAIKQGAMQELLTGKRRLPGFSGEWEVKRLGDHLDFLSNGANSRAELLTDGQVRYLHYGDIHGTSEVLLNPGALAMPFLPVEKAARLDRLRDGDVVFADASEDLDGVGKSTEMQGVGELQVVSGMHTIAVRFDKGILADGFKAYLQVIPSFRNHLRRLASGTKVYATNMTHISSAELALPKPEEQVAISKVLSDMDAEITALETQRVKTAQIKQGMMQELLTGRIRLV